MRWASSEQRFDSQRIASSDPAYFCGSRGVSTSVRTAFISGARNLRIAAIGLSSELKISEASGVRSESATCQGREEPLRSRDEVRLWKGAALESLLAYSHPFSSQLSPGELNVRKWSFREGPFGSPIFSAFGVYQSLLKNSGSVRDLGRCWLHRLNFFVNFQRLLRDDVFGLNSSQGLVFCSKCNFWADLNGCNSWQPLWPSVYRVVANIFYV